MTTTLASSAALTLDKENQTHSQGNVKNVEDSSSMHAAAAKATITKPGAAGSIPEPSNAATTKQATITTVVLSPWEQLRQELEVARDKMGHDAVLVEVTDLDTLMQRSGILERELGEDAPHPEDLEPQARLQCLKGLSKEQVEKDVLHTCVPLATMELQHKNSEAILYSDTRYNNTPG
eukprot:CAMPEP_0117002712 /NCGR_PEP_ID=MMETSP0472-20121206/4282_1 /TAXON_ID=693140 ORGANISM="Tiarina fusus, Strain LIS" /NCGR_SAMPLE_ID=MMETSP0472 /ASSEMBLY_ACC=CAM_ASM_000603 /LENGTH=177 /DNA_ID=CAMNT_0004703135 /DNA_START=76 /DNA_END=606 /DNA_ORIENTATION=+